MTETVDDRSIINNALARIGASPIGSLDEATSKARQVKAVYSDRVDAMLGMHRWTFAGKTYRLDPIATVDSNGATVDDFMSDGRWRNGWRYAYGLPGNRLSVPRAVHADPRMPAMPLREFFLEEDRLYADRTPLYARFTVRVAPHVWLPTFRLAVTVAVAADLCVPITHDVKMGALLRAEAEGTESEGGRGGLIGRALAMDAAGAPIPSALQSDPLSDARFS